MNREQAINYLISSGFTNEQVCDVVRALTYEPTTKNDLGVDIISRNEVLNRLASIAKIKAKSDAQKSLMGRCMFMVEHMSSVTPQLSVPEVTALAEWTEKLTKECEEAYNKGYADGVKSVNICPHCGEYIGEEE